MPSDIPAFGKHGDALMSKGRVEPLSAATHANLNHTRARHGSNHEDATAAENRGKGSSHIGGVGLTLSVTTFRRSRLVGSPAEYNSLSNQCGVAPHTQANRQDSSLVCGKS